MTKYVVPKGLEYQIALEENSNILNVRNVYSQDSLWLNGHGGGKRGQWWEWGREDGEEQLLHNCEFSKLTST